jgi:hypothetical protein
VSSLRATSQSRIGRETDGGNDHDDDKSRLKLLHIIFESKSGVLVEGLKRASISIHSHSHDGLLRKYIITIAFFFGVPNNDQRPFVSETHPP